MAGAKVSSKQKRINDIAEMLYRGMERKKILQKLSKTCKLSARTIDNEIKAAKEAVSRRQKVAEEARLAATKEMTEEAMKEGLKSDLELEVILCKIAGGGIKVQEWINGGTVLRDVTPGELCKAIDLIYKKRGSYPETSIKLKGDKDNPIIDFSKATITFK
jgi:hypothetical protein